jgi:hypothetical protein
MSEAFSVERVIGTRFEASVPERGGNPGVVAESEILGVFRTQKQAWTFANGADCECIVKECSWANGVERIRRIVFERDERRCVACTQILTWNTMHCHERVHRGKGGPVSVDNCEARCYHCHLNVAHGNRRVQSGRKSRAIAIDFGPEPVTALVED